MRLVHVQALSGFRLAVEFEDGSRGEVSLAKDLWGPAFEALRDPAYFAQVALSEFGAPTWPNRTDIAPDAIYAEIMG